MKNKKLFIPILACLMGVFLIVSGNNLAQADYPPEEDLQEFYTLEENLADAIIIPINVQISIANSVAIAVSALGDAIAVANSTAVTGSWGKKIALATAISRASSVLGSAMAIANAKAITQGAGARSFAKSLAVAQTFIGNATAIASSAAIGGSGAYKVASSLAIARTAIGNATAIATSYAGP